MNNSDSIRSTRYRVWLAKRQDRRSQGTDDSPAIALEPAEEGTMSARQAARYVTAFNRAAADLGREVRAIALPVSVRYDGDPEPGRPLVAVPGRWGFPDRSS